jgi:excinuclease UvrABC nuclease subunit
MRDCVNNNKILLLRYIVMNAINNQNSIQKKIQKLEDYKLTAIQNQKFEEAAMIRDRISKILSGDFSEVYADKIIEDMQQKEKEQKER